MDCSIRDTARKDSAVRVSLSSDSLVKQPGASAPSPVDPESHHRSRSLRRRSEACFTTVSEGLQRRAITPRRAAHRRGVYRGRGRAMSTVLVGREQHVTGSFRPVHRITGHPAVCGTNAALGPHSCMLFNISAASGDSTFVAFIKAVRSPANGGLKNGNVPHCASGSGTVDSQQRGTPEMRD
jgi:hypothetical protein